MNTRDPLELAHFKNMSSTWWDEKGPLRLLHRITPQRVAFIKEKVGVYFRIPEDSLKPFHGLRILDVGCGGGILCEPLARLGAEVTGIDPLEENIALAKAHAKAMDLSITYLSHTIEELPQNLSSFDVIIASEIIEHVKDQDGFLKACVDRLSPDGGLVVTTFNKTLKSYVLGIIAAEYILNWAPRGTHSWEKFISPEVLSQKLKTLGLGLQEITGLRFSPLSGEWGFSSSTDVNYFLWGARCLNPHEKNTSAGHKNAI
ncbi:MAG: bifunctional 2-polyprenyl-6-hydroxyphenol methylase/3-demethylubiquinol 3-O-methyltransferase UbiG [Proteobacteria bacterium]|nr:bifunctional 2-polyprenyl-6-hydroxyphenol methylase/3-demethylubiquinol 3-O-methyltransferase UbiG [Pseudomonadota bacterium]